jgi:uncharacterized protein (TIGR02246 family)
MAVNCEKVVGDLFAAWTRLNLDEVMSQFAEDAVWDNVPMSPAKGKQAIREMTRLHEGYERLQRQYPEERARWQCRFQLARRYDYEEKRQES